jgi:hypothetical protein
MDSVSDFISSSVAISKDWPGADRSIRCSAPP